MGFRIICSSAGRQERQVGFCSSIAEARQFSDRIYNEGVRNRERTVVVIIDTNGNNICHRRSSAQDQYSGAADRETEVRVDFISA